MSREKQVQYLRSQVIPCGDNDRCYDEILAAIGDAEIVLLGEATHGTDEFYRIRSKISQRLIKEKGFTIIAVEADWPDAYQINQYIQEKRYVNAQEALTSFERFPTWMWRNMPMVDLIEWLFNHNKDRAEQDKVGFYGLDVYSLYHSIDIIIEYLAKIDLDAAKQAKAYYSCLDHYRSNPQAYGYALFKNLTKDCKDEVVTELKKIVEDNKEYLEQDRTTREGAFNSEQNARVVRDAEHYYRSLFFSDEHSWNIRDSHMFDTIQALLQEYQSRGIDHPKIIVWAHNSHIGNANATEVSQRGEYNIGQLVDEHYGERAFSLGFTTYNGTVTAASDWHASVERKIIRNAREDSYEKLFHDIGVAQFLLKTKDLPPLSPPSMLERAIGVVYRPDTERQSHYFYADLPRQFDAVMHCDTTHALEPLDKTTRWIEGELPETYPTGI